MEIRFVIVFTLAMLFLGACSMPSIDAPLTVATPSVDYEERERLISEANGHIENSETKKALECLLNAREIEDDEELTAEIHSIRDQLLEDVKKNLVVTYDSFDERTWVKSKTADFFHGYLCHIYVNDSHDTPVLRMVLAFAQDGWLFAEKVKLKGGDMSMEITPSSAAWSREIVSGGRISEYLDIYLTKTQIDDLRNVLENSPIDIRFYGSKGNLDIALSNPRRIEMLDILEYYDLRLIK